MLEYNYACRTSTINPVAVSSQQKALLPEYSSSLQDTFQAKYNGSNSASIVATNSGDSMDAAASSGDILEIQTLIPWYSAIVNVQNKVTW